jgi:hypothetical protein
VEGFYVECKRLHSTDKSQKGMLNEKIQERRKEEKRKEEREKEKRKKKKEKYSVNWEIFLEY